MSHEGNRLEFASGEWMHGLARELWPIHRSITGEGLRESLRILAREVPGMTLDEVPSGTKVFDWVVPKEWVINSATLTGPGGEKVIDYSKNNLHVVGYSEPVDGYFTLKELDSHLHSIPEQPDAVPYVTSYYNKTWGLCLTHKDRLRLTPGIYHVKIDSDFIDGSLTYGEAVFPGKSTDEILLTTYVCHPSMANNELSGPVVAAALANYVHRLESQHYTYRFAFTPETIGAISYASRNLQHLKSNVVAAFNLTCIGDDRAFTYLASRSGDLRVDRVSERAVRKRVGAKLYSYLERGSDERHYGAPGIDLPMVSLMRSRYADYPEYHTSLDDLENVVTPTGLQGGFDLVRECLEVFESEEVLVATQLGEPQLGRRGLYHVLQKKSTPEEVMLRTNILAYADGNYSMRDLAEKFNTDLERIQMLVAELIDHDLIRLGRQSNSLRIGDLSNPKMAPRNTKNEKTDG